MRKNLTIILLVVSFILNVAFVAGYWVQSSWRGAHFEKGAHYLAGKLNMDDEQAKRVEARFLSMRESIESIKNDKKEKLVALIREIGQESPDYDRLRREIEIVFSIPPKKRAALINEAVGVLKELNAKQRKELSEMIQKRSHSDHFRRH